MKEDFVVPAGQWAREGGDGREHRMALQQRMEELDPQRRRTGRGGSNGRRVTARGVVHREAAPEAEREDRVTLLREVLLVRLRL